jgi:hypothetical protein
MKEKILKFGRFMTPVAGVGLIIARVSEPYVYNNLKKDVLCCSRKGKATVY